MTRFYLLPEEATIPPAPEGKGPKYLAWRFDPDPPALVLAPWIGMAYGLAPAMLIVANIDAAEHTLLSAQTDVAAAPEDLNTPIAAAAIPQIQTVLEALHLPAQWVDTSYTYRGLVRGVAGFCQFAQRHRGLHLERLVDTSAQLDLRWNQISQARRARLATTAASLGYDTSAITSTTSIRAALLELAQQWGAGRSFRFYSRRAGIDVTL